MEEKKISKPFFNLASFGKRMEYWIIGEMLRQGLDVYTPLVDDKGIDAIVRRPDGTYVEVQIKARSKDIIPAHAALFAGVKCEVKPNYWFIFHSASVGETGTMWIMTAKEFMENASQNKTGKQVGSSTIWFNGYKFNKATGKKEAYVKPQFEKYVCKNFNRLLGGY